MSEDLEALAHQSAWLHRLARRLLADANLADDVVQESMLRALRTRTGARESLSAWLGGVARNVASSWRRQRLQRDLVERNAASAGAAPATDDLASRVEQQRLLATAVLALDEPYRSAILLRFYEGLSHRQIATRLQVPKATVSSRIARALAKLRERLDRDHEGNRQRWVYALVPLAKLPLPVAAWLIGGILVKQKLLIATAAIVLAVGGTLLVTEHDPPPVVQPATSMVASAPEPDPTHGRSVVAAASSTVDDTRGVANLDPASDLVSVVVKDSMTRAPIAGADVFALDEAAARIDLVLGRRAFDLFLSEGRDPWRRLERFGARTITDAQGRARVPRPDVLGASVMARQKTSLGYAFMSVDQQEDLEVLMTPTQRVTARVIDAEGQLLDDVPVALRVIHAQGTANLSRRRTERGLATFEIPSLVNDPRLETPTFELALDFPLLEPVRAAIDPDAVPAEPITLVCPPVGSVQLEVAGPGGAAIADGWYAQIAVTTDESPLAGAITRPLSDGKARFTPVGLGLDLAVTVLLRFDQEGFVQRAAGPRSPGEVVAVALTVPGSLTSICGRLLAAVGAPVKSELWRAHLRSGVQDRDRSAVLKTDASGRFHVEFADHPDLHVTGNLELKSARPKDKRSVMCELNAATPEGVIDLGDVLVSTPVPLISGRVVGPEGQPIAGAEVSLTVSPGAKRGSSPWPQSSRTDARGCFEMFGESLPSGDLWITSNVQGPFLHDPVPLADRTRDVLLVMRAACALDGQLLLDPGISAAVVNLRAWPESRGPRESWSSRDWKWGVVDREGRFHINQLEPGSYTVAAGPNADMVYVEGIQVDVGRSTDARLQPLDLRGRVREIRLSVRSEAGEILNAVTYAIYADGQIGQLNNSINPIMLPANREVATILVECQGYFPASIGPVDGSSVVVLKRGLDVTLQWTGTDPLPEKPFSLCVSLESPTPPGAVPGGARAATYLDSWGPHHGAFGADGRVTIKVPEAGRYRLRWQLKYDEGFTHREDVATDAQVLDVSAATHLHAVDVSVPPSALRDAFERARAVLATIKQRNHR